MDARMRLLLLIEALEKEIKVRPDPRLYQLEVMRTALQTITWSEYQAAAKQHASEVAKQPNPLSPKQPAPE